MRNLSTYDQFINESKLQNDYRDFFSKLLELYNVKSPSEFKDNEDIAKKFYDYFTAGEWVDSKGNKVINWKQKFLTWIGNTPMIQSKPQMSDKTKEFFDKYKKGE